MLFYEEQLQNVIFTAIYRLGVLIVCGFPMWSWLAGLWRAAVHRRENDSSVGVCLSILNYSVEGVRVIWKALEECSITVNMQRSHKPRVISEISSLRLIVSFISTLR